MKITCFLVQQILLALYFGGTAVFGREPIPATTLRVVIIGFSAGAAGALYAGGIVGWALLMAAAAAQIPRFAEVAWFRLAQAIIVIVTTSAGLLVSPAVFS